MIDFGRSQKRAEAVAAFGLLLCSVIAIANLPRDQLPLGWLVAWTAPATFFGCLRRRSHRPWLRTIAASATQIVAFALALEYAGPLSRPAILACTILPPLAFVSVRRRDADAALGLFLSFCVLLVGVILGGADLPLLAGYGVAACLSLRFETHLAARAASTGHRRARPVQMAARPVFAAGLAVAIPCLFAAFAIDRTLAWVPSPLRDGEAQENREAGPSSSMRRTGLDDSFLLGGGGLLADLAGEQLVLARTDDRSPMPADLYLRSGFFAQPEMHRWRIGQLELQSDPGRFDHTLARPRGGAPVRWLEIERFAGARNFVFVPPHAIALRAVPGLEFDPQRMWLRQSRNSEQTDYAVAYQRGPGPLGGDFLDPRGEQLGLLTLPDGLQQKPYLDLLDEWSATGTPQRIAQRIAQGLAARCRYDRIDPVGPYRHAIDNFLFSDEDRRGFCMHFATAAALMLRLRGIPCRIGVGLYGGDQDRQDPEARIYGSQHAHAWVEIAFAEAGYVIFDPTPPEERGRRMPTQLAPGDDGDEDPAAAAQAGDPWAAIVDFLLQPWLLLLVLVLAVLAAMWPASRVVEPEIVLPRSIKSARRLLVRILRALATSGHLRHRGETLEQFSSTLRARDRLRPAVADAFRTYQEVRFGGYPFDAERESRLQQGIEEALATEPAVTVTTPD